MLLNFSKRRCLLIQSGFMWIKFHLLPLILVVSSVEVSPATVSSDTIDSSSSASVSSSSGIFFISFPWSILIFIEQNYIICIICFLLFVMLIYSFWSSWFHFYLLFNSVFLVSSISWIVTTFFVYVELATAWFSLVTLIYQMPLNTSSRSYSVHKLTGSATYQCYGHNRIYLTIYCLYRILPYRQQKTILIYIRPLLS